MILLLYNFTMIIHFKKALITQHIRHNFHIFMQIMNLYTNLSFRIIYLTQIKEFYTL